ncbi:hypothetical protein SAMN05720606_104271 [Paenibacillus polysaccharolyticus]|uniref:Uncharacterized protein n=1 Tax=Paenibacillus polysaccharolyticus TaxID=582692 RepID=A0A1G5FMH0_9BACL|nr:hypothetical protein SAMN05720606_104271 [Paenibacillus polysaccharolyticus]
MIPPSGCGFYSLYKSHKDNLHEHSEDRITFHSLLSPDFLDSLLLREKSGDKCDRFAFPGFFCPLRYLCKKMFNLYRSLLRFTQHLRLIQIYEARSVPTPLEHEIFFCFTEIKMFIKIIRASAIAFNRFWHDFC